MTDGPEQQPTGPPSADESLARIADSVAMIEALMIGFAAAIEAVAADLRRLADKAHQ
jgi:hypothetical protein